MEKIRRYDLDWIRVIVFNLLIFYHIGMYYVQWNWHINNEPSYDWVRYPMLFVNQWRLNSLFLISGMGTFFALSFRTKGVFIKERLSRLGIPFLFGTLVIVAPQVYIERITNGQFSGGYFDFYPLHFFQGIYPTGNFSWHHLWFLIYLLFYSLILAPVFIHLRDNPDSCLRTCSGKIMAKPFGIYLFIIPLYFFEAFVEPLFDSTHAFIDDWFNHMTYCYIFLLGFIFMLDKDRFFNIIIQKRWLNLAIGTFTFLTLVLFYWRIEDSYLVHFTEAVFKVVNFYVWILAIFGFAAKHLNRGSRALSYLNRSVYPFYIFHQTIIIILIYFIEPKIQSDLTEFILLVLGTYSGCIILYEIVKRTSLTRVLFGIKSKK